jgi:uncharacterized small protein (DUF1192 family)
MLAVDERIAALEREIADLRAEVEVLETERIAKLDAEIALLQARLNARRVVAPPAVVAPSSRLTPLRIERRT